jgi:hypothetical protein
MKLREFIFKFRNNLLGLNTRVSHFNGNVDRLCTFCKNSNVIPVPEETFTHLFFECSFSKKAIKGFCAKYMPDYLLDTDGKYIQFLFCGMNCITGTRDNFFLSTVAISIMLYIWECKLRRIRPAIEALANDIFYGVENIGRASSTLYLAMNLDLHICRNWKAECSRRD